MKGETAPQEEIFVVFSLEKKVPQDHPLRSIKKRADAILEDLRPRFKKAYSRMGRPSIPPEQLLKALVLQALYSIRSERQLVQDIDFNLLYRWFLDLSADEDVWGVKVFSMNRQRFEDHGLIGAFFSRVVQEALAEGLVSEDHFSVDGTLIQSWASLKSLKPRDEKAPKSPRDDDPGNPSVNFRGQKRTNATHVSATDPEARLYRKGEGQPALLCHSGHVLMENRHGLCVEVAVDAADGRAERRAAREMLKQAKTKHGIWPRSLGADAAYDDGAFLCDLENQDIKPMIPIRNGPIRDDGPKGDARRRGKRRMGTQGYALSQRIRKRAEEIFGWAKTIGGVRRTRFVGRWKTELYLRIVGAAYNLLRMSKLAPA